MTKLPTTIESKHFTLERLAEGVYGAVHREGGWAIANAGIVDLGEGCLVFDTLLTPAAGADLRLAAEELTGQPVRYVISSHFHNDHIWGNQAFDPETPIISSAETRRLIETRGREEYDWYLENSAPRLTDLKEEIALAKDQAEREKLGFSLLYYHALAVSMPMLEVRQPTETFESQQTIQGSNNEVVLTAFGMAHSGGDTILHIPDKGIVFTADLLFVDCHPYIADGEPEVLLASLEALRELEPVVLLPGHGPVGAIEHLDSNIQYLHECLELAQELAGQVNLKQEYTFNVPQQYAGWEYSPFFQANMRYLVSRAQTQG